LIRSKTLRVAAAGFLAAAGLAVIASPAGADDPDQVSMTCGGARAQGKLKPGINFAGQQLKATTSLFKDLTNNKAPIGGTCTANFQLGGSIASNGGKGSAGTVPGTLNPITMSSNLNGTGSCDQADPGPPPTAADYPLNGQVSLKMSQMNALGKNWQAVTYVTTAGFVDLDVVQIVGMGVKGLGAGAQVSGQFYFDPIKKPKNKVDYGQGTDFPTINDIPTYDPKTGMMLDLETALACAANLGGVISLVEVGTGPTSLLGTVVAEPGLTWKLPTVD
jgi:hypothetical protein